MKKLLKILMLFLIYFYQSAAYLLGGKHCKFSPSCSEYAKEAIEKYGAGKGAKLALKRLLSCRPFAKGGYDPVP